MSMVTSTSLISNHVPTRRQSYSTHLLAPHKEDSILLRELNCSKLDLMEVEIISKDHIKPATPTPHHLRTFKISLFDQIIPSFFVPFVLFYHNHDPIDTIAKKTYRLRQSLSETLSHFYPFAGKEKDDLYIDCNDEGVYYVEARVNCRLNEFLHHPDDQLIKPLFPQEPDSTEVNSGKYVVMVQINIFDCGGLAISTCISHKIMDGNSYVSFMKAWAGFPEVHYPNFTIQSMFPQYSTLPSMWPKGNLSRKIKTRTRRFVFNANALDALKTKCASSSPSRVVAVSSLIWKSAAKAATQVRDVDITSHLLVMIVNFRAMLSPILPKDSIGNAIWFAFSKCMTNIELDLGLVVDQVKEGISNVKNGFVKEMKGEKMVPKLVERLKEARETLSSVDSYSRIDITSFVNFGVYDVDFGWGKPAWFYDLNPGIPGYVVLVDTKSGNGIEATVTVNEDVMAIFECDPELLAYSSVDPSPLEHA